MNIANRRSPFSYIPDFSKNVIVRLIIFLSVMYVILGMVWGVMMIINSGNQQPFDHYFLDNLSLPLITGFKTHWWCLFTYGIFHSTGGFWDMLTNMIWLYCFGALVQMMIGYRQVVPIYIYSVLCGGIFFLLSQLIPAHGFETFPYLGPIAGVMGMAVAAVTISPSYKFFLTDRFSISIMIVAGIFVFLMVVSTGFQYPLLGMLLGGGLSGYIYIRLLRAGYKPGEWMYAITNRMERLVTPDENADWKKHSKLRNDILNRMHEPKHNANQKRIDDLLDKINQKGYNSLTNEEKDILLRAGNENKN